MSFRDQMGPSRSAMDTLRQLSGQDTSNLIGLDKIRMDGGTQPRAELDEQLIDEYAADMLQAADFPPVVLFYDGENYWLADGFHRVNAAKKAGLTAIKAEVLQGGQREAVLYSVGVNAAHGKRRTNADKRRAVLTLLADSEWSQWSDNQIAAQCRVSQPFVGKVRNELKEPSYNEYKVDDEDDSMSSDEDYTEMLAGQVAVAPEIVERAQENVQRQQKAGTRKVQRGDQVYEQRTSSAARQQAATQRAPDPSARPAPKPKRTTYGQFPDEGRQVSEFAFNLDDLFDVDELSHQLRELMISDANGRYVVTVRRV